MGRSVPGNGGRIERVSSDGKKRTVLVTGLPSVEDIALDEHGNILVCGNGKAPREWAVTVIPPLEPYRALPLKYGRSDAVVVLPRNQFLVARGGILSLRFLRWPRGVKIGGPVSLDDVPPARNRF